jgi:DNA-binding response OmpR family regulator
MKHQILVVDDSMTIRMDLRGALTAAGFSVTACETKALAQKVLQSRPFSLVLLDVTLPDGDGLDLLKELRATPGLTTVPVILLSAELDVKPRLSGVGRGADEYIGKPYDLGYLVQRVSELVEKRQGALATMSGEGGTSLAGKRILVVDDSLTYRATLAQLLRQEGCEIFQAHSGEESLALVSAEAVDCVIMDLVMPGIGGMEAARRLKANPATAHLPVMILTGHDDGATRDEGARVGVDDFVIKSPDLPLLKGRLRSLFRRLGRSSSDRPSRVSERPRMMEEAPVSSRGEMGSQSVLPPSGSLLEQVVLASGLSSVIGPSTIIRACRRAGIEPMSMSPAELQRAMPAIRETLRMFLSEEEYTRATMALSLLIRTTATAE